MNINELSWDFDFKRILLGENYEEDEPIKNILRAKGNNEIEVNGKVIEKKDKYYAKDINHHGGDVEYYQVVEDVFQALLKNENTEHKDVMNSFWTTYKCMLQIEYPEYFMPVGYLKNHVDLLKPTEKEDPDDRNAPSVSKTYKLVHDKYIKYYNDEYPNLKVNSGDTWVKFLLNNFDEFSKVHNSVELNKFATLTHTIGNFTVVPEGFNSARNLSTHDYWDWGLKLLKEDGKWDFRKIHSSINKWEDFIDVYFLNNYVDEEYQIIPFWDRHLESKKSLPKDKDINKLLIFVNNAIELRGQVIINKIN